MKYFSAAKFSVNTLDPKFADFFRITLTFTMFIYVYMNITCTWYGEIVSGIWQLARCLATDVMKLPAKSYSRSYISKKNTLSPSKRWSRL